MFKHHNFQTHHRLSAFWPRLWITRSSSDMLPADGAWPFQPWYQVKPDFGLRLWPKWSNMSYAYVVEHLLTIFKKWLHTFWDGMWPSVWVSKYLYAIWSTKPSSPCRFNPNFGPKIHNFFNLFSQNCLASSIWGFPEIGAPPIIIHF